MDFCYSPKELWAEYDKLYEEYQKVNTEAEAFPTKRSDMRKATSLGEVTKWVRPNERDWLDA